MNFDAITNYLEETVKKGIPSVDCIVYKDHQEVYRHMAGTVDEAKQQKIKGNERYLMFSMTKVQTMTATMQLVEQGKLSLDDEVGKYLPAYKNLMVKEGDEVRPAKNTLKIWHLVSMQSGLDYELERPGILEVLDKKGEYATTREIVDAFVKTPLIFEPGEHFFYSLSHDVMAAIIEVVSGMSFGAYLRKKIWEPLHMTNTFFAKPLNDDVEGLAKQYICDDAGNVNPMSSACCYQFSNMYESGGAGLISTTEDYAVFADTLACGGISKEGKRIISAAGIERMKENLLGEVSREDIATSMGRVGYGYGCGVQILMEPEKIGSNAPKGIFGWDGAAGSCIMMDTERKISVVYTQHVRNCGMAYAEIHPMLRDLVFGK